MEREVNSEPRARCGNALTRWEKERRAESKFMFIQGFIDTKVDLERGVREFETLPELSDEEEAGIEKSFAEVEEVMEHYYKAWKEKYVPRIIRARKKDPDGYVMHAPYKCELSCADGVD